MSIVFKAEHPIFGRGSKPLGLSYQQRSPYYWWWEFLRRNEDYKACCETASKGALAGLYADFGVVSNDNFKDWWAEHGFRLFAEKQKPVFLTELDNPSEWDSSWTKDNVMVVAVPLDISKRNLQGFFARLLKERHGGKRGRKALSDSDASTARYPLHRNVSVKTLKNQLNVYDAVMAKKQGNDKRTLAKIGADLGLVEDAMPDSKDDLETAMDKRNVMSATVSRYFRQAQNIVANTAKGQFPNSDK
jgi:hypothetical protein